MNWQGGIGTAPQNYETKPFLRVGREKDASIGGGGLGRGSNIKIRIKIKIRIRMKNRMKNRGKADWRVDLGEGHKEEDSNIADGGRKGAN
ncbi:hypothetical protein HYR69_01345 [Candidatus Sumerlaeota bacterium]|nr:hypothetical protein [Candidatus Sumerlaeota bacterium]